MNIEEYFWNGAETEEEHIFLERDTESGKFLKIYRHPHFSDYGGIVIENEKKECWQDERDVSEIRKEWLEDLEKMENHIKSIAKILESTTSKKKKRKLHRTAAQQDQLINKKIWSE